MEDHDSKETITTTRAEGGIDGNFGALIKTFVEFLASKDTVKITTQHSVPNNKECSEG